MTAPTNQSDFIIQFLSILWREVFLHKGKIVFTYAVVSIIVVCVGLVFPKKFVTSTTLYADQQNIIKPLLSGTAMTKVQDRARIVREVIYSPRILSQVVIDAKMLEGTESPAQIETVTNKLRSGIQVKNIGSSFIRLTYSAPTADIAYDVITSVSDRFIRDSSDRKRKESREAFQFISSQVKTYKKQLQDAEQNLKEFNATNVDGSEAASKNRISQLHAQIEEMKLDIDDTGILMKSLEQELAAENQFINRRFRTEVYLEQIRGKQQVLDALRLSYTETYPDVVTLKLQIEDLQQAMKESQEKDRNGTAEDENINKDSNLNPLYEELRSKLSTAKVELATKYRRVEGTKGLLDSEEKRLKRIAGKQAELSELTRDYNVTKSIYESMLEKKESARLSMTLDIEGQGVKYKIQEPAAYPLVPKGIRFIHFAFLGQIIGGLVPLILLIAFILVDPRIRFVDKVVTLTPIPVLGVVPHIQTPLSKRIFRTDIVLLGLFWVLVASVYIGIGLARHKGII